MRNIFLLFLLLLSFYLNAQTKSSFENIQFDKVVMYDFDPSGEKGGSIIETDGSITKNIKKEVVLNKSIINILDDKLKDKNSFNWGTADCFDPHLGFVYYNKSKIVGFINVCFSCNRLYASFILSAQTRNNKEADAVGMSKSLRYFLNEQLKKYNFSNQIVPGSGFDK